ncbi:hypothetical protein [Zavarzinella formosa]|uniref:hypothetical protein n=1 Tax=Zavarzinella formosa TaxID=360055 RepID=UPI00037B80AC|nr:hypothetical protein [Zavarzinella formosa]
MRASLWAVSIIGVIGTGLTPANAQFPPAEAKPAGPVTIAPKVDPILQPANPMTPTGPAVPPLSEGQQPARTDADPSVQFPSSFLQPPPAASQGQPLSGPAPFDWNHFRVGGQFRIEGDGNNFPFHPISLPPGQTDQGLVTQRYRLWLTYTPNDNVEGYIQMQVGGIHWGTNYDFNKNFNANYSPIVGDRVGIELRRAWLAYKEEDVGKVRVGFLDWHDSFNDTLASSNYDFNQAGIDWTKTVTGMNNLRLSAAMLLLADQAFATSDPANAPGTHTATLFAFDADQPLAEQFSVGGSAYVLYDRGGYSYTTSAAYRYALDTWLGVRAKWTNDVLPLAAFFITNSGRREDVDAIGFRHTGFAT